MDAQPGACKSVEPASAAPPEDREPAMAKIVTKTRTKTRLKTERPRLHKVILVNDDYTPREFRMTEEHAYHVMMTAHQRGVCVVAVYAQDIAETKATRATELGRSNGYPLLFTTEPEE